ncbi:RNA recognition motif-containing protein [Serendipita sp. 401]|nr:RNA recognition motif-containing protein [Serendipita sp. 401]
MREKADKRNLYLMREGVIFPNSPAASTIPPAELEKRMNSFNARRNLIQTNPSLYVSKTRLSIRQLPTFVSERLLKRLARHAIKAFDEETEKGERDGLEEDEMDDEGGKKVVDPLSGGEVALSAKEPKGEEKKKTGRKGKWSSGAVKQAKIVRLSERVDPLTGKGKSKGYGFLETEKHADALKILRWANNNPETGSLFRLWWVDEMKEALDVLEKKTGKKSEEEIARMKRLKEVIATSNEDGVEKAGSKRTLVVEFSIENVVIIKKREGRDKTSGPTHVDKRNQKHKLDTDRKDESKPSKEGKSRASRKSTNSKRNEEENSRPSKRPRMEQGNPNATPLGARIGEKRPSNPLGSIIGRKRKMKKMNSGRK